VITLKKVAKFKMEMSKVDKTLDKGKKEIPKESAEYGKMGKGSKNLMAAMVKNKKK
jgi:hypothetical protein